MGVALNEARTSRALVLHPEARDLAPTLVDDLVATCGDAVRFLPEGSRRPWVRDYCPRIIHTDDGGLTQLTFLSPHPGESRFFFEDLDAEVRPLQLVMRGGAMKLAGDRVFVSRALVDANRIWPRDEAVRERYRRGAFTPRTIDEVRRRIADALEVTLDAVMVLRPMPGEGTGHLTPVLRPLPDGRTVVPELTEDTFGEIGFQHEIGIARLVQTYLDVKAAELTALGLDVVRLPMLPPIELSKSERPEGWVGRVHSSASAALIMLDGVRRAYLPTFDDDAFPVGYRRLKAKVLSCCQQFYADAGFAPVLVDATAVARAGGSLPRLLGVIPA